MTYTVRSLHIDHYSLCTVHCIPGNVCVVYRSKPSIFPVQELYDNVKKEEFKVPDGEGGLAETFFNPEREGWLTKEGGKYKSKHRRWFILKEGMLYYFKQPSVSV